MNTPPPSSHHRGFTLVEVMIAAMLVALVIGFVFQFFLSSLNTYGESTAKLNVNGDLRNFTELITRDCAGAQTITATANSVTFRYRSGRVITYTLATGTGPRAVTRLDSSTGRTTVEVPRITPIASGNLFTVPAASTNTLIVAGQVSSLAKSRVQKSVQDRFELLLTRRG